jgi:hypothetical protein
MGPVESERGKKRVIGEYDESTLYENMNRT